MSTFDAVLMWSVQVIYCKYHAASPRLRAYKICLVEIVAVAIHQIPVYLYKTDLDIGGHKVLVTWVAPANEMVFCQSYRDRKLPSLFKQEKYWDLQQYPIRAAYMVGYWAEAQILGCVVLFDRRKPRDCELYEDPDAPFFRPNHKDVTYHVFGSCSTHK